MRSGDATKVETAALFGNDTRRGQRRKVDDTHVRHFFGEVEEGRRPFTHPEVMLLTQAGWLLAARFQVNFEGGHYTGWRAGWSQRNFSRKQVDPISWCNVKVGLLVQDDAQ